MLLIVIGLSRVVRRTVSSTRLAIYREWLALARCASLRAQSSSPGVAFSPRARARHSRRDRSRERRSARCPGGRQDQRERAVASAAGQAPDDRRARGHHAPRERERAFGGLELVDQHPPRDRPQSGARAHYIAVILTCTYSYSTNSSTVN